MSADLDVISQLPTDVSEKAMINSLHNHDLYIQTTCPNMKSCMHVSGTPKLDRPCVYKITDRRAFGEVTFVLTLTNMAEGVDAVVEGKTPIGSMVVRSEWRVCARRLKEVVGIESNPFTKNIVRKNIEKSHYGFHKHFATEAVKELKK
ncbi:hypothetical protein CHU98_g7155 [Xylaria longipes]|nr:hypothetical protein CHU98_g7155 [Xylaria longipes]